MTSQYPPTQPPVYPQQEQQHTSVARPGDPASYAYPPQSQYPSAPATTTSTVVVTQQPTTTKRFQGGPNPYSHLLPLSMVNSFFCCFCLGMVAVYYSIKVNSSWSYGDLQEVGYYAKRAKIWNIITLVTGLLLIGAIIALNVARVVLATSTVS